MSPRAPETAFSVNGREVRVFRPQVSRLADILRDQLGLLGTKIGCNAGDCGACTVLLDGEQICACMVPLAQAAGRQVTTVEGLASDPDFARLQDAFHRHGAAQCGICTPGMLMAAADLIGRNGTAADGRLNENRVKDALGGVLCRCTGYRKIVEAVLDAANGSGAGACAATNGAGPAVGARLPRVDGLAKLQGTEEFGADAAPDDALWLRVVRSPHAAARFSVGALDALTARFPGLVQVLSWADIPGNNGFGIYPDIKDQPVLAKDIVRYRGEAVLALVGDRQSIEAIRDEDVPIDWQPDVPVMDMDGALAEGAPQLHADRPDNILTSGLVRKGDPVAGLDASDVVVEGSWETGYVEHAYIEPEAGYAVRVGDRIEIRACTQTPYMDRDEVAQVLGLSPDQVRIAPTACGGGFGGKLDLSLQPLIATAAWLLDRPVRCVYTRPESMASSTKRHPARMAARFGANRDGKLTGILFRGEFNTGAYASWGPTVADRVPVHASGPYMVPAIEARSRAVLTNGPPSGAFRGFGVPQAALVHEGLMDELADRLGMDLLEFRLLNALRAGDQTATGQTLKDSAGLAQCLEALRDRWRDARADARAFNRQSATVKRGVGIGCMWYGIGNTSISNPSTMKVGLGPDGRLTLYNGAQDIGQGSATIMLQICADALGVPVGDFDYVMGDTDLTPDAGKTSASRQAFVSGRAAQLAGEDLRGQILRVANTGPDARIEVAGTAVVVRDGDAVRHIDLAAMPADEQGHVLTGSGTFDPPTTKLDDNGQGDPYACYGFAAQFAEAEVDCELGTVHLRRFVAAHDVGKAINPTQVEGQIHGGIAQGIGFALMEEYFPGKSENLHDYLIPTVGDVPEIECIIVENATSLGPYGAKGIGEPALVPTAPAILGAIHHATGARIRRVPATPDRVRAAIRAAAEE